MKYIFAEGYNDYIKKGRCMIMKITDVRLRAVKGENELKLKA